MKCTSDDTTSYGLEPSPLVRRFAPKIAAAAAGKPVIDVACGSGRNALALAQLGCSVICVDRDLTDLQAHVVHLRRTALRKASAKLSLHQLDLVKGRWPFTARLAGAIINVHFLLPKLFPFFERSLSPGGYLLLETVPGCGGNYLELPKAGELRSVFERTFELEFYQERKVGPLGFDAVTVRVLGKKRTPAVDWGFRRSRTLNPG
jgi:SAM-dependent methyltransferase